MLEGTKVNLRAPEMSDLDRSARWVNDAVVTRFLALRYQMSRPAEEAWLRQVTQQPGSFAGVLFAIETKDGRHIGNTDLRGTSPEDRTASLGIMIGEKDCWSQGYGGDAILTLLRFAFDEINLNKVALSVFEGNDRAHACCRRCGFVEEGRLRQARYIEGLYRDEVLMSILRGEFYALHGARAAVEVAR
jgi:RimJ/RimL family protein N-acetyltransferase